jgi:3-oxoacyl-[acyl-carrier-protein] synthase II
MKPLENNRVVITGLGAVSPFGDGAEAFFSGIREGRSGSRRLSLFSDPSLLCQVAAEAPGFDPLRHVDAIEMKRVPRVVPMAIAAGREALKHAGVDAESLSLEARQKISVVIGTGGGGIEFAEKRYEEFFTGESLKKISPYSVSSSFVGMLSSEVSIALGLHGASHVVSTGCTSSTDALGYAYRMVRAGHEEMVLSGGAEACITRGLMAGFCQMKVMSTHYNDVPAKASRPFDKERDGFVLGEGAWLFVLESRDRAIARGAKIYAEITGYGSTCEAYHRVAVKADGVEPARAMKLALEESGIASSRVPCIQLHGTGTKMNDSVETKAVRLLFGPEAGSLSTSALKSMIGHPQGACGAAGVMAGIFTLEEQFVPPTINYENPDPECDLDYTPNRGVERDVPYVLCNTIAFGSKNSALVLRHER